MKRRKLACLIVINVVLLAMLAMVSVIPSAEAQAKRRRGDYMLIASKVNGNASIVYVYDTVNRDLIALTFRQGKLTVLAPARNINNDLGRLERGGK